MTKIYIVGIYTRSEDFDYFKPLGYCSTIEKATQLLEQTKRRYSPEDWRDFDIEEETLL